MRAVIFTARVHRQLREIWDYVAADSPAAADAVIHEIEQAAFKLALTPGLGHSRQDVSDPRYRFYKVGSYLVGYQFTARTLRVMHVVHGARDFGRLFGKKP